MAKKDIASICAELEAAYVEHARFLTETGVPYWEVLTQLSDYHHAHGYAAYQRARLTAWKGLGVEVKDGQDG